MKQGLFRYRYLALLIGVVYLTSFTYFERWNVAILHGGDGWGYYGYLPATFLYGDLADINESYLARFNHVNGTPAFPAPGGELPVAENGHRVIKYTCGIAILQAPFFGIAHLWASLSSSYAADGFSFPYIVSVMLGSWFYILLGGWLLFRLLAAMVDRKAAFWAILIIALGTHFYNFAVYRADMSHTYLAALYAMLMFGTWQLYKHPRYRWAILVGVSAGLITLIRPVEILCLAIPLTYGLINQEAIKKRWQTWQEHWPKILAAAFVYVLCGIPQLLYWKNATGHWTFDSYPGEAFDFTRAKIAGGLFSYQNGWLVYAPITIFALLGIYWLFKHRHWLWPVLLILPLHIYIAYSWWCWYYINGFGSRPMVEMYTLLAIPLAYWIYAVRQQKWSRWIFGFLVLGAISLQIFQNWQHSKGILWTEFGNEAYYWTVFGQTKMSYEALVAFDSKERQADSTKLHQLSTLMERDFELADSNLINLTAEIVYSGEHSAVLTPERQYFELVNQTASELTAKAGQWVKVRAMCRKERKEEPFWEAPSIVVNTERGGQNIKYKETRIDSKLHNPDFSLWGGQAGHWDEVRFWYCLPAELQPDDRIKVYFAAKREPVYIDNVEVELWAEK